MKYFKILLLISLTILMSQPGYSIKRCTIDLPIVGINNYEWVESNYPTSNDMEIAYAACRKATELAGDKLCNVAVCTKYMMDWSPGTGAYGFLIHASSIGHSHSPGNCNGGDENFIFGYNYDNHQRGGHCSYPTAPGKIDWYHSGSFRGCHENGAGSFSCEDSDPFCGDGVCNENEGCGNCNVDCSCGTQICCNNECQNSVCVVNSDCDDKNELTIDKCNDPNSCSSYCSNNPCKVECHAHSDCNDNNPLTIDKCNNPNTCNSDCTNVPCAIKCNINLDCDDNKLGTVDICNLGGTCGASCTHDNCANCSYDSNCNDNNPLTIDKCNNPNTCSASCSNEPCDVACSYNSDCNDNNDLTNDVCISHGTCLSKCSNTRCDVICQSDLDCNDQNPNTIDRCNNPKKCESSCSHSPKISLVNNNICDISAGEDCETAPSDCKCSSYERCENGVCKGYCGNGRKDTGETCSSCLQDVKCPLNTYCSSGICQSQCGNGAIDNGETCSSCPEDVKCGGGMHCKNSKCVGCLYHSQCTKPKDGFTGEYYCGPDNKNVYEKGYKYEAFCRNEECVVEKEENNRLAEDCGSKYCQEDHCGCSEDYEACSKTGKCEKQFALGENAKCGCDFQCESGYCSNSKCLNALDIAFSSTKSELKPGEEATITLSVSNNLNKEVQFSGTVDIGTGSEMVEIISGDDCSGNQCKISGTLDEMGRTETTIVVKSNSNKPIPLSASVGCIVDNKELEIRKEDVINKGSLTEITGNVIGSKSSGANLHIGALIIFGVIVLGLSIIYFAYNIGKSHNLRKNKK